MNHYEELGVLPSATTAEIRQAYRSLVRVLHPDLQQDEDLRRLCELQLRRLNHLFHVLSDPELRRMYNLSLQQYLPAPRHNGLPLGVRQEVTWADLGRIRVRLRIKPGAVVWILIGAIALSSAIFWIRWPVPEPPSRQARERLQASDAATGTAERAKGQPTSAIPVRPEGLASEPERKRDQAERPERERRPASEHSYASVADRRLAGSSEAMALKISQNENPLPASSRTVTSVQAPANVRGVERSEAVVPPTIVAVAPKDVDPSPPPTIPKAQPVSVSGKWLYVPRPDDSRKSLYPAEYIELRINNRGGVLQGKYYGKYRVSDRAISSEIKFKFEGRQGDEVSILPWAGNNGSKGEMRLKRLSDESIEVNWITTTFGQSNTLASGTAVLYRSDPP